MARNTLANICVLFVPLGFIGGAVEGNWAVAFGSAAFWFLVFMLVRPKNY